MSMVAKHRLLPLREVLLVLFRVNVVRLLQNKKQSLRGCGADDSNCNDDGQASASDSTTGSVATGTCSNTGS